MTPEKRNEIMDALCIDLDNHRIFCTDEAQRTEAILECDRRARAWEELRQWARDQICTDLTCAKMDELIPPEPVDKLERLRAWVVSNNAGYALALNPLLLKIKELQDEDR